MGFGNQITKKKIRGGGEGHELYKNRRQLNITSIEMTIHVIFSHYLY